MYVIKDFERNIIPTIKNKIPLIFLDSNILINIIRYKKGKSVQDQEQIAMLSDILLSLINRDLLICPHAQQCDEILSESRINDWIILKSIFNDWEFAEKDVIRQLQNAYSFSFFLGGSRAEYANFILFKKPVNFEYVFYQSNNKGQYIDSLNEIKKSLDKTVTYEEMLNAFFNFESENFLKTIYTPFIPKGIENLIRDFERAIQINNIQNMEYAICMYDKYLASCFFRSVPYFDVERRIFAKLLFDNPQQGDPYDIINVAAYFPCVDYYVTDNKMCQIIKDLKLDTKYHTKVFCMSGLKDLISELKTINANH